MDIVLDLEKVLASNGLRAVPQTDDANLRLFFRSVWPAAIQQELIRVGGDNDGGYLIPDDLCHIAACFSPGVGNTCSFEEQLAKHGIPSYMADLSISNLPLENDQFCFEQKYVSDKNDSSNIRLEDWVCKHAPNSNSDLILQMDIEGSEFCVLLDTPRSILRRFRMMVIEFHAMEMILDANSFRFIQQIFQKLLIDFSIVHIHPNNCCPISSYKNFNIPTVLEFTFYRNDRIERRGYRTTFPHPLDAPNIPEKTDIVLPECWWIDV